MVRRHISLPVKVVSTVTSVSANTFIGVSDSTIVAFAVLLTAAVESGDSGLGFITILKTTFPGVGTSDLET